HPRFAWLDKLTMREGGARHDRSRLELPLALQDMVACTTWLLRPTHLPHGELVEPRTARIRWVVVSLASRRLSGTPFQEYIGTHAGALFHLRRREGWRLTKNHCSLRLHRHHAAQHFRSCMRVLDVETARLAVMVEQPLHRFARPDD